MKKHLSVAISMIYLLSQGILFGALRDRNTESIRVVTYNIRRSGKEMSPQNQRQHTKQTQHRQKETSQGEKNPKTTRNRATKEETPETRDNTAQHRQRTAKIHDILQ